ncbi:MAG: LCP family protein, partial [Actinobacteria bacterium]|nr:LCP family protein [Actinomycetota bacterium]
NTDTMMILHVPANGQRATIISLPRDSWVQIPGHGLGKLNAAFPDGVQSGGDAGGAQLLIATIQNMTGLTIDHFVRVSLLGFYDIANVLGPIKVCLNQPAEDSYSGVNLPAGVSQLNAQQALAFVRQRHNLPRGDLDREVRQQYFLSAAFRKVESAGTLLNPFKLKDLLSAVSSSLETDPGLDLLKFAQQFENLSAGNVTYSTIPITGTPTITYDGDEVSIVAVDTAAMPGFIARVVGPSTAYTKAAPAAPTTVRLQVINATGQGGAAATATTALSQLGFQTAAPGDQMKSSITFIEYPAGMEAQAKALGNVVPGAAVRTSNSVSQVTLVLGSDGVTVNGAATATPSTGSPSTGSTSTGSTSSDSSSQSSSSVSSPARTYSDTDCIN